MAESALDYEKDPKVSLLSKKFTNKVPNISWFFRLFYGL